ncbi:hypothetical protein ADL26_16790, partial [Thermoactinomyces vulgaris]
AIDGDVHAGGNRDGKLANTRHELFLRSRLPDVGEDFPTHALLLRLLAGQEAVRSGDDRHAEATDRYTLAGDGVETWEPAFTFHGFRYAEVQGWPGEFDPADVTAVVVHSDMDRTGWFDSSH